MSSPHLTSSSSGYTPATTLGNRASTTAPSSALSKRARQIQQDEGFSPYQARNDDPPPPSLLSSDDPPVVPIRGRPRAGTLPSRWDLPLGSFEQDADQDAPLPTAPHRPFTLTLPRHAGDYMRHASDIDPSAHRPSSRLLADLRDEDDDDDLPSQTSGSSQNRARSGSLSTTKSASNGSTTGSSSFGPAFGPSIWQPSHLPSQEDKIKSDPWGRAMGNSSRQDVRDAFDLGLSDRSSRTARPYSSGGLGGLPYGSGAAYALSSPSLDLSLADQQEVAAAAAAAAAANEHEQLSHLFHSGPYIRNRATTLASMARPSALPALSSTMGGSAIPSSQHVGRNRSSTFAPAPGLRGDRFSTTTFPDDSPDAEDDDQGPTDVPVRTPSAAGGTHTPSHHGGSSLASAALHNRLGQLVGDSAPSSAAVSIVANANRPRAISMGVLDGPTPPPSHSQVHFGSTAYEREEDSDDMDIYAAYALEHGLDLEAFTALAAAAGMPGVTRATPAQPVGRLRAGTVAALGGAGPGGRHRTEQELMRMASADPSLARRLHLAGIAPVAKPSSPGISDRHSSYMTAKDLTYPGSMPSSPSGIAHALGSPGILHSPSMSRAHLGTPQGQTPNRSLWIGNLHPSVTGQELMQVFAPYGAIESLRLLPEKECGFVNFVETADAVRARDDVLNRLGGRIGTSAQATSSNGTVRIGFGRIDAMPSTVPFSRGVSSAVGTPIGENGPMTPGESPAAPTRALWIGSIPSTTAPATLLSIFTPFGPIESARVLTHKNCGFINFERVDDAVRARKALNGRDVLGPEVGAVRVGYAKVPLKTAEDALPGQQDTEAFSAALEQLHSLKGAQSVPVEQQVLKGDLDDYRSNMVMSLLHLQKSAAENLPNAAGSSLRDAAEEMGQAQRQAPRNVEASMPLGGTAASRTSAAAKLASDPLARLKNPSAATAALGLPSSSNSIVPSSDKGGVPLPSDMAPRASVSEQQLMMRELSEGQEQHIVDVDIESVAEFRPPTTYYTAIPLVSEVSSNRRFETARLREMKRDIEAGAPVEEVDEMAREYINDIVDLASDYIGNTLVQKFFERCSERVKLAMLTDVAPHLAMIGIHKNGTWAAQKIIDTSRTNPEMRALIARHLRPYVPPLLLDQFGNYVVQCVIPFPGTSSDFVFDAMVDRCWEIAQGRFGARSMRACLENALVSRRCQKRVAIAIVLNSVPLATSPNGALLLTWYLDQSNLPGRYRLLAPRFAPHLVQLCTHKVASLAVLRIVNQKNDVKTSREVVKAIFEGPKEGSVASAAGAEGESVSVLEDILTDQVHGSQLITKVLSSTFVDPAAKPSYMERTRQILLDHNLTGVPAYRRLVEELGMPVAPLPTGPLPTVHSGASGAVPFEPNYGPGMDAMMSQLHLSTSPSGSSTRSATNGQYNNSGALYGSSPPAHPQQGQKLGAPHLAPPNNMFVGSASPPHAGMQGIGPAYGMRTLGPGAPFASGGPGAYGMAPQGPSVGVGVGAGGAGAGAYNHLPPGATTSYYGRHPSFDLFNPWAAQGGGQQGDAASPPQHPQAHGHGQVGLGQGQGQGQVAQQQQQQQAQQQPHGALFAPRASFSQMYEAAGLPRVSGPTAGAGGGRGGPGAPPPPPPGAGVGVHVNGRGR